MMRLARTALIALVLVGSGFFAVRAESPPGRGFDSTWVQALEQMVRPQVTGPALQLRDFTFSGPDFSLVADSATFLPFAPLLVSGDTISYGGFLSGHLTFSFRPKVSLEQDQLRRFFKADSLAFPAWEAVVFFDPATLVDLRQTGVPVEMRMPDKLAKVLEEFQKPLTRNEDFWFLFTALRAAVHPRLSPYLLVNCAFDERDQVVYLHDPYHREQIHLFREHNVPGEEFMELVCQYVETLDSTYQDINGRSADQLTPLHYDIDGVLWSDGKLRAKTAVMFAVIDSTVQFVRLVLHPELQVDSIVSSDNQSIPFRRYRDDDHKQQSLYVFLPEPMAAGDTARLTFWYSGDIAKRKVGEFHVEAGAAWYPRYGYAARSTFSIRFKTPRELIFILSGERVDSTVVGDTLVTAWTVTRPAANIGFNIGHFTRYNYGGGAVAPIALYYNAPLHRSILKGSGQRVYRDVGADLEASLRLYDSLFGRFPYQRLVAGEIVFEHGESFPGFLHLGANTFTGTDPWGADQLFRAHEVAHQWFGSTVGYETYHDQWLSEGCAEYAALLYLQQQKGDKAFLDKIREYRKSVFSARRYLFFSGEESGPIIQGFRTASSKTEGDYNLIIYRKAALVLHMIRGLLSDPKTGDDNRFFAFMRAYVARYADRPATTAGFQALLEEWTGAEQTQFFRQWVYGNELPEAKVRTAIAGSAVSGWTVECTVERRNVTEPFMMELPLEIIFDNGPPERRTVSLAQPGATVRLSFERKPKKVQVNPFEFALISVK